LQVSTEKTIFMQKAIYFVSKFIAARGILELTDRKLNFQVSHLDASFGMKNLSIDLCSIRDVMLMGGDLHPKVLVACSDRKHEFVLTKGQELYDRLKEIRRDPLNFTIDGCQDDVTIHCSCGKYVNRLYRYCPWCGLEL